MDRPKGRRAWKKKKRKLLGKGEWGGKEKLSRGRGRIQKVISPKKRSRSRKICTAETKTKEFWERRSSYTRGRSATYRQKGERGEYSPEKAISLREEKNRPRHVGIVDKKESPLRS